MPFVGTRHPCIPVAVASMNDDDDDSYWPTHSPFTQAAGTISQVTKINDMGLRVLDLVNRIHLNDE